MPAREVTLECICTSDCSVVFHCIVKVLRAAEKRVFETNFYNRSLAGIFVILKYTCRSLDVLLRIAISLLF
jgi:hypothetical protein